MQTHRHLWTPESGWDPPLARCPEGLDLVLYFGSAELLCSDTGPLAELLRRAPAPVVAGCCGAGMVCDTRLRDDTLVAVGVSFAETKVRALVERIGSARESGAIGARLGERLFSPGLRHVLLLSDGMRVSGSALVDGLRQALPPDVSVSGGMAGAGGRLLGTPVGLGEDIGPGRVVAVGFWGDSLQVDCGIAGGWLPFGPPRVVTRSEGVVVHRLDNEPALALYRRYLGRLAGELPAAGLRFPLQILSERPDEPGFIRTLVGMDEAEQSITFAGDIPQGARVRLMRATRDSLIDGVENDLARPGSVARDAALALAVSCVGRRVILGQRCEEELERARMALPASVPMAGFYSFGEFGPCRDPRAGSLHNQTFVLTLLGERSR